MFTVDYEDEVYLTKKENIFLSIKYWGSYLMKYFCSILILVVIGFCCKQYIPPSWETLYKGTISFNWKYDPNELIAVFNSSSNYTILIDARSHTQYSSGSLTPEQNIQWHLANGFNAVFITDINEIKGAIETQKIAHEKYKNRIVVMTGIEWSTCRGHYNLLFDVKQLTWDPRKKGWIGSNNTFIPKVANPTNEQFKTTFDSVHKLGGIVVVDDIPGFLHYGLDIPSLSDLVKLGIDYIEVGSMGRFDYQSIAFAQKNNIGIISGTNMYNPQARAYAWTGINTNLTAASIMDVLKTRKTDLLWNAIGSPSLSGSNKMYPGYIFLSPLIYFGQLIEKFYDVHSGANSFVDGICAGKEQHITFKRAQFLSAIIWLILFFVSYNTIWYTAVWVSLHCICPCKDRDRRSYTGIQKRY